MKAPRARAPGPHRTIRATLAAVLACVAATGIIGSAVAAAPTAPAQSSGFGSPLSPVVPTSTFAERAGFSPSWSSEVSDPAPTTGSVDVVLTFQPTDPDLYDAPAPGAAPMSVAQIANTYGLSASAYVSIESYFEAEGLSVLHAWPDRLSLSLAGSASRVDAAFDTSLVSGLYHGRSVSFPASAPSLPAAFESEVASVAGLSSGFDTFSLPSIPAPLSAGSDAVPAQNPADLVTPSIARDIYDVSGLYNLTSSPTYATGKGIVLLLWGLGYAPADLSTFFSQFYPTSFPAPTINAYPVDGASSPSSNAVNDPSNGSHELTLDLEWSGSMAPGATLDAVYAPPGPAGNGYSPTDSSMIDALNTAVDPSKVPNVATISMSFGSADGGDPSLQNSFETDFGVAAHEGITVFASTGDTGGDASTGCGGGVQPEYPAASPQVVAVGGTTVSLDRSVLGAVTGFSETAWSLSGGGFSSDFAAPSWQEVGSAAAPIAANGHRGMPDVAASADYNFLYFDGQQEVGAGTSFSTPLWAGLVTEMDALQATFHRAAFGFLTPRLYELAATESSTNPGFHDITSGSNCIGSAGPGWDPVTGWGSPDGLLLYEHLVSTFIGLTAAAGPSPVAPGGTVTITALLTNASSGAAISGVPVSVTLSSTGLGGPCSGTFGQATIPSNASGMVVVAIPVSACYLGSGAVATVTVTGEGYYGVASASVAVNLLGFSGALTVLSHYPDNVALFVVIMAIAIALAAVVGRRPEPPPPSASPPPPPPAAPAVSSPTASAPSPPPAPPEPPAESPPRTGDPRSGSLPPTPPL